MNMALGWNTSGEVKTRMHLTVSDLTVVVQNRRILDSISLTLQSGQILALIGPNGAGKSTLIRALSGVIQPQTGRVEVDEHDLLRLSPMQRARYLAVVPQMAVLPPAFTVWQTVLLGRTPHLNFLGQMSASDEQIAHWALEQVDALHLRERRMGELSGGEVQRVLLARALAQQTPFLLLDEPTTHLDLQYQVSLLEQIRALVHGGPGGGALRPGVLMVVHDLNQAVRYADSVALLVAGRLQAWGGVEEVMRPEVLSRAFGLPITVLEDTPDGYPLILPVAGTASALFPADFPWQR